MPLPSVPHCGVAGTEENPWWDCINVNISLATNGWMVQVYWTLALRVVPDLGATDSCELPCGCWDLNQDPLKEQGLDDGL